MFTQKSFYDDAEQEIMVDSSLLAEIDQRLGDTFLTREAFIATAIQEYVRHIDEAARTQTIHGVIHISPA